MLALMMLLRCWRGGQHSLILLSLVLAVAVVTSVSFWPSGGKALVAESSAFLAADLVVSSSVAIDPGWLQRADEEGVVQR